MCSPKGCFSVWPGKHVLSIAMEEEGNCLSRYGSPQFVLSAPTQRPPFISPAVTLGISPIPL